MKPSIIVTMLIALMLSSTASAVTVHEAYMTKNGKVAEREKNFFYKGKYINFGQNGQAAVVVKNLNKGANCKIQIADERTKRIITGTCMEMHKTTEIIKQKYGGQAMALPTTPAASGKLKPLDDRKIGGVNSKCFGNEIETICASDKLGRTVIEEIDWKTYEYFESMGNGMSDKDPEQTAYQALKERRLIEAYSYITSYKSWLNVKSIPGLHAMPKHVQNNFFKSLKDQGFVPPGWEVVDVTNELPKTNLPPWPPISIAESMQIPGAYSKDNADVQAIEQSGEAGKRNTPEMPDMDAVKKQLEKFGIKGIEIPKSQ